MNVLILSAYGVLGASSRVRFFQYLPYLEAHGVRVTNAPLLGDDYIRGLYSGKANRGASALGAYSRRLITLCGSRRYDLLWIERELFPWLPAWSETLLRRLNVPYVVDYDDAIFHKYDRSSRAVVRRVLGDKIDVIMRNAALVVAGNDYLAARAQTAGAARVEQLPSVIDCDRYAPAPVPLFTNDRPDFTIGWIGTPVTAPYLRAVQPALAEICRNGQGRVTLVGSGEVGWDGVPTEVRAWSEATEVADIQTFDVGIMPLPDAAWERGKCAYKLIQYMGCGVPVVASPVGVNQKVVENGVNGFLATSQEDWVCALHALRQNRPLRARMGQAARQKIEREYSLQGAAPRLLSLLQSAVKPAASG